jgi:hypothetical protein
MIKVLGFFMTVLFSSFPFLSIIWLLGIWFHTFLGRRYINDLV